MVVIERLGRVAVVPSLVHLTSSGVRLVRAAFFSAVCLVCGVVDGGFLKPLLVLEICIRGLVVCGVVGLELVLAEAELPEDGVFDAVALVSILVDP